MDRQTIGFQVTLIGEDKLNKLEKRVNDLQSKKININIDTSNSITSLNSFKQLIDSINNSIKDVDNNKNIGNNLFTNASNQVKDFLKELNVTKDMVEKVSQTQKVKDGVTVETGDITKYNVELGKTITLRNRYNELKGSTTTDITIDKDNKSIEKTISSLEKLYNTLDKSKLSDNVINDLETKINNIKTDKSIEELSKLNDYIKSIGKNSETIVNMQNRLDSSSNSFNNLSNHYGDILNNDKVSSSLERYKKAISEVKSLQLEMSNGRVVSNSKSKESINELTNSFNSLRDIVKQVNKELSTSDTSSFSNDMLSKISIINSLFEKLNKSNFDDSFIEKLGNDIEQLKIEPKKEAIDRMVNSLRELGKANSDIDRLTNRLENMGSDLEYLKSKFADGLGTAQGKDKLDNYVKSMEDIATLKDRISKGDFGAKSDISTTLNKSRIAAKELNRELGNTITTSGSLGNTFRSIGIYLDLGDIVRGSFEALKDGISNVIELEDAMVSLKRVYDGTAESLNNFKTEMIGVSKELATNTVDLVNSVTEYKKLGYSIGEATTLAKETTKFDLAGDINNMEESTQSVTGILKGFRIEAGNVTTVIDEMNTASNEYAISARDIAEILKRSSSALYSSGNNLEDAIAMGTVAQEVERDSSKVGNALKTLSLRMRGVSEDGEALSATLREDIKTFTGGFDILNDDGTFKSTREMIQGIGAEFDELTDLQKAKLTKDMFGERQANIGLTLLNNYEKIQDVLNSLENSQGSVNKEFNNYLDSTTAKAERLKATVLEKWNNLISSDMTKGAVEGITNLVDTFGNLPGVIGLATTALLLFKGKALLSLATDIVAVTAGESAMTVATVGLSTAFKGLWATISANPLGAIATIITGLVTAFALFSDSIDDQVEETITNIRDLQGDLSTINGSEDLVRQYQELENKVKSNTLSSSELAQANSDLIDVRKQLAEQFPDLITGFTEEGDAIVGNSDKVAKAIQKNKDVVIEDLKSQYKTLKQLYSEETGYDTEAKVKNKSGIGEDWVSPMSGNTTQQKAYKYYLEMQKQDITLTKEQQSERKKLNDQIKEFNNITNDIYKNSGGDLSLLGDLQRIDESTGNLISAKEYFEDLAKSEEETAKVSDELRSRIEALYNSGVPLKDIASQLGLELNTVKNVLGDVATAADKTRDAIKSMSNAFGNADSNIELLDKAMKEFSENGIIGRDTAKSIFDTGDFEMINLLNDQTNFMNNANNLKQRQIDLSNQYYHQILQEAKGEVDKANTSIKSEQAVVNANAKATTTKGQNYSTDNKNYNTTQNNKLKASEAFANGMLTGNAAAFNGMSGQYQKDVSNFGKATNAKIKMFNDMAAGMINSVAGVPGIGELIIGTATDVAYKKAQEVQMAQMNLEPVSVGNPISLGNISSGSGSGGSGGSGGRDYGVENLELEDYIDNTARLNQLLEDVEHSQSLVAEQIENSYGKDKINLQKKYIKQLEEERGVTEQLIAQNRDDSWRLRVKLDSYGIKFDNKENIINMNEVYTRMINLSNATNDTTEEGEKLEKQRQKEINTLKDTINKYQSVQSEILKLEESYQSLGYEIKDVYESMSQARIDGEERAATIITDKINKMYDENSKILDKLKDKINETFDEEEVADKKAEYEKQLLELRGKIESAMRGGNQTLITSLKNDYQELQKEYSNYIKDNERDNALKKLDKEQEILDNEKEKLLTSQNMTKLVREALTKGYTTINGQVLELNSATKEWVENNTIGLQTINKELNDYTTTLQTALDLTSQLNTINSKLNYVSNLSLSDNMQRNIDKAINKSKTNTQNIINFNKELLNVENINSEVDLEEYSRKIGVDVARSIDKVLS